MIAAANDKKPDRQIGDNNLNLYNNTEWWTRRVKKKTCRLLFKKKK